MLPPGAMMNAPKTILQLLPRLGQGGAERVAVEIAAALREAGHSALIAAENGPLTPAAQRAGAEILPLPLDTKNPFKIRFNGIKIKKLAQARGVELIHAHSRAPAWSGEWAARANGLPFVTTYHGSYSENSALKRRYNAVMARGDIVVAVSHYIAGLIAQRYGVPEQKVRVVHGGVDTQIFDPAVVLGDRSVRLARAWRADAGLPAIMLPGRLTGWKGQKLFIEALALMRHKEVLGLLVGAAQGGGAYTRELEALARARGIAGRLRFAGHAQDMPAALMLADIVVNCSTRPEAFGRTIVEAQAMGRVVAAARHGGACETIEDGVTGLLVSPNSAGALAEMLDGVLDIGTARRIEFGRRARAHVERNFSLRVMQEKMLAIYAELLG